jgi:drug/metabolite transporter (DMT)-like permease
MSFFRGEYLIFLASLCFGFGYVITKVLLLHDINVYVIILLKKLFNIFFIFLLSPFFLQYLKYLIKNNTSDDKNITLSNNDNTDKQYEKDEESAPLLQNNNKMKKSTFERSAIYWYIVLCACSSFGIILSNVALIYLEASVTVFLVNLYIILTVCIEFIFDESSKWSFYLLLSVIGSVIGTYLVAGCTIGCDDSFSIYYGIAILSALSFALYYYLLHVASKQYLSNDLMRYSSLLSIPLYVILLYSYNDHVKASISIISTNDWLLLLSIGISDAFAWLFLAQGYQEKVAPTVTVIISSMDGPVASILAYFIVNESLTVYEIIGCVCILLSVYWIAKHTEKTSPLPL